MIYRVDTDEGIKRCARGKDSYDEFVNANKVCFCTKGYLRRLLRGIFDNRTKQNPYLVVHHKPPQGDPLGYRGGTMYEGVQIEGWTSVEGNPDEDAVSFRRWNSILTIKLIDIVELITPGE